MDLFLTNSSLVQATHNPKVGIALNHSANAVILPPPAALSPLEPLAGSYMLPWNWIELMHTFLLFHVCLIGTSF